MPELTHDTTEDGFHEIQLSRKQLVFLFMATTVLSVVIFLCGVLVGRSVGVGRESEPIDSAVADGDPAATPETGMPAPGAEPPAPIAETDLKYHERLLQDTTREQLKPRAGEQPPSKPAPPAAPPAAAAKVEPPAGRADAPPAASQSAGSQSAGSQAAANVPTSGRPGTWFLQVTALRNRTAAADTVRRLIDKGYPAFLENPVPGAAPLYRVRIGRYSNRDEAEQVALRLQKEEQFTSDVRR